MWAGKAAKMRGAGVCELLGLAYVVVLSLPATCCVRNLVSSACKKRRWRNLVSPYIGGPRTVHERCKLPKCMLIACLAVRVKYVLLWDAMFFCRSEGPQEVPNMHVSVPPPLVPSSRCANPYAINSGGGRGRSYP